jgi:hypothetical protein
MGKYRAFFKTLMPVEGYTSSNLVRYRVKWSVTRT